MSETDSSAISSVYITANSIESDNEFSPFDDTIAETVEPQPLASPEEGAEYEEAVAEDEQLKNMLQDRFVHVDVSSW